MSKLDEIKKIKDLLDGGFITQDEFEQLRNELSILKDENPEIENHSVAPTKKRLAAKLLNEKQSSRSAPTFFASSSQVAELNKKIENIGTSITDAGGFAEKIFWNIVILSIALFLYSFVLGFIQGYAEEVAQTHPELFESWFKYWFSPNSNGQTKIGIVRYVLDLVVFTTSIGMLKSLYGLGKSLGRLKKIEFEAELKERTERLQKNREI